MKPLRVLIAEDNARDAELVLRELRRAGFEPDWKCVDTEDAFAASLSPDLDVILSDYNMPQFSGTRALEVLQEHGLEIPFIIISGTIGEEIAVRMMKLGATDYLLKDRLARLGQSIAHAMEQGQMRRERKQAEVALRESEERFRQLAENVQEVFWLTDPAKTQMLYVSPAYETIWGRSCAELYAAPRTWLEAIHPEDRERILHSAVTKQTAGGYDEEYRIIRPDGTERWVRDRAFPVTNAAGEVDRVAGVARDITARKQAEEALRLFRNLVDQSNDTFEVIDPATGRFVDVNAKGPAELGCSREEYLSLRAFDIDPTISEEDWPQLVDAVRTAGSVRGEGRHRRKDGTTFPIEFNTKWVRLDRDYIVAVVRDITERVREEERVREHATMLNLAHDAILVRGVDDQIVSVWNKGAERLYGWTAEEAIGRDIGELTGMDPTAADAIRDSLLGNDEWRGENRHKTRDRRKLIVHTRATLVRDEAGKPKSVLSINTDITEQKSLEARFLRAQRMESVGTLASGVAHDLNNILSPIMMSVPMLRRGLTGESLEEIISTIEMSAERGAQIVRQVLTFGRGIEGERHPLQIEALIKEMMKIMRGTFPKSIAIESALGHKLPPVLGDATQLHQVLLNLCVNARDAMPEGGKLRLAATPLDLDASYASMLPDTIPGPYVLLEISDTGSGIPPEIVERIWDPFFTTKGVGSGTGLGLSTVLGIVKSHGGIIQVNTQAGHGTTFQVYLPAAPAGDAPTAKTNKAQIPRGQGEVVLVVDDETSVRGIVRVALATAGYEVLVASDGAEALAVFSMNSKKVAVVLTDLMMPFMDGVALVRALRAMAPNVPIIASTGLGQKAKLAQLKTMGVETILHKPYGAEVLMRTVHHALHPETAPPS